MPNNYYNPANWLWQIGDNSSNLWSSSVGGFVPFDSAAQFTRIASLAELEEVLINAGLPDVAAKLPLPVKPILKVSAAQAYLALNDAGLLDQVTTACNNHPVKDVGIWFSKAGEWERQHPYVLALAIECNIPAEQVDALFLTASKK